GGAAAREPLARLFQDYATADPAIARKFGGTGLGLAISRQLVTLMHGEAGVETIEGDGGIFWFQVGLAKQAELAHPLAAASGQLPDMRVLVVDAARSIR